MIRIRDDHGFYVLDHAAAGSYLHLLRESAEHFAELAIDETRLVFAPTLWEISADAPAGTSTHDERVKQVWFEGAHADVGGGYPETGLSDTALLWMAREARAAGLVFDVSLLSHYVASGSDPIRHDPLTLGFRLHNAALTAGHALGFGRAAAERP